MATRMVSFSFIKSTDSRRPIRAVLHIEDDETDQTVTSLEMDEHQLAQFLSGSVIHLKEMKA